MVSPSQAGDGRWLNVYMQTCSDTWSGHKLKGLSRHTQTPFCNYTDSLILPLLGNFSYVKPFQVFPEGKKQAKGVCSRSEGQRGEGQAGSFDQTGACTPAPAGQKRPKLPPHSPRQELTDSQATPLKARAEVRRPWIERLPRQPVLCMPCAGVRKHLALVKGGAINSGLCGHTCCSTQCGPQGTR